jgi:ATP-dependent Clp protease ATP-binding subunit ClpC
VSRLAQAETEKLLNMKESLHERVVGQDQAIEVITRAIRRSRAGLKNPSRPIGSFIFLGPTGVGKTEVARSLAAFLFDDEESMIRIDMSEYMEKYSVSRLVGAPPGYVGYEEGGQLTEAVRRRPYSVVLLDEIEKAHPDVFNLLLQVLDDGRLTDSQGRQVDFKNCVIVMTSNVGATGMQTTTDIGFRLQKSGEDDEVKNYERMKSKVMEEVKQTFRPEFLNRVDEVVVFHQLTREQIEEIVGLELEKVAAEVKAQEMDIKVTEAAKALLARKGWDPQFGARPLRRAIQRNVEDELAEEMLKGHFGSGDHILADVDPDDPERLKFSKIPSIDPPAASQSEPVHA